MFSFLGDYISTIKPSELDFPIEIDIQDILTSSHDSYFAISYSTTFYAMKERDSDCLLEASLEEEKVDTIQKADRSKGRQLLGFSVIIALAVVVAIIATIINPTPETYKGQPHKIIVPLPSQDPFQIELGTSRVLEVLFFSGNDNRTLESFQAVTKQEVKWSIQPEGIVTVDPYGRLEAVAIGKATINVASVSSPSVTTSKNVEVIQAKTNNILGVRGRVVNFKGKAAKTNKVIQKLVDNRLQREQALLSDNVPESIKRVIRGIGDKRQTVKQDSIVWQITKYADGSNRSYIIRYDNDAEQGSRDKVMNLMGGRYLPGDGMSAISIESDGQMGIWTVNSAGQVTHIGVKNINYSKKADILVEETEEKVERHGMAADSRWNGTHWIRTISDNDGLWTAMFGAGQLMRYASAKRLNWSKQKIAEARKVALRSLKAVLMMYFVSGRDKVVDARIHHRFNSVTEDAAFFNPQFLKKGKVYAINNYPGNPAEGIGYYGPTANMTQNGIRYGGQTVYTYQPIEPSDWSNDSSVDQPATTKRTLNGFKARTFTITALQPSPGGLSFRHNPNKTQTVISGANTLYDYKKDQNPTLDLGDAQIPDILLDILNVKGVQYNKKDLTYKGDTSSDETVGHLFIFKIAFDILDEKDEEQRKLKEVMVEAIRNFCQNLINNGYSMVDATGQGTKWIKMTRDTMNNDFDLPDAPIKSLQVLISFNLCYYVTGEQKWKNEYQHLINHPSFRYLDIVSQVWDRWKWQAFNCDYNIKGVKIDMLSEEQGLSQEQIVRHMMYGMHYSDDQEAFLGFYTALQLETKPEYREKYLKGMQGYWKANSRSENPLWYYIYQLGYPEQAQKDHNGNLLVDVASWQLSRHPTTTQTYSNFIEGSREDVIIDGNTGNFQGTVDPHSVIQRRKHVSSAVWANHTKNYDVFPKYDPMNLYKLKVLPHDERSVHKFNGNTFNIRNDDGRGCEASTSYTLPLWMGVYHKMLVLDDE